MTDEPKPPEAAAPAAEQQKLFAREQMEQRRYDQLAYRQGMIMMACLRAGFDVVDRFNQQELEYLERTSGQGKNAQGPETARADAAPGGETPPDDAGDDGEEDVGPTLTADDAVEIAKAMYAQLSPQAFMREQPIRVPAPAAAQPEPAGDAQPKEPGRRKVPVQ